MEFLSAGKTVDVEAKALTEPRWRDTTGPKSEWPEVSVETFVIAESDGA